MAFVPAEILSHIALHLVAADPFRPPADLCAFQAVNRFTYLSLNPRANTPLWEAAFRYRFDGAAVIRRNFHPSGRDWAEQLKRYTEVLVAIRTRNIFLEDLSTLLSVVYLMLLENNGKNRTQLEAAGIYDFVLLYVRNRLWSQAHLHDGWPEDSTENAYALWSLWMLTTNDRLLAEDMTLREQMVAIVLPFVLNPYRYRQAEAPPSHFHFPIVSAATSVPHTVLSAHGPYPVYVSEFAWDNVPYFGALPQISPPLIVIAAKLLYFARRESIPFPVLPHLAPTQALAPPSASPTPTQEDIIEANSHKGSEPPPCITWDWNLGCKLVNALAVDSNVDDSRRWDCDFWRRRLCGDPWRAQPKWRPGKIYTPGSLDGLWHGRLMFPSEQSMHSLVSNSTYSQQSFNELMLSVTHRPMLLHLHESHAIHPNPPVTFPPRHQSQQNDDSSDITDLSMCNSWFLGTRGSMLVHRSPVPPLDSLLYSPPDQPSKVAITIDGQQPPPGSLRPSPYAQEAKAWIYHTFDRQLAAKQQKEGEHAGHLGHENCPSCREREALIKRGEELDQEDREAMRGMYGAAEETPWWLSDQGYIDRMFESVGLDLDQSRSSSVMDEDEDYQSGMETGEDEEEEPQEELSFLEDPNADVEVPLNVPRVRRATDRAKIEECDGIRDIVFDGFTHTRHGRAWGNFTYYGRVRPWDGLIGILRRSVWPQVDYVFFYGYLVGDENFVGNWRYAGADPDAPTWESSFVLSRRKEENAT